MQKLIVFCTFFRYLIGKVLVNYEPDRKKTMEPVEDVAPPPAAAIEA